jgi:RING finger protein 121
MHEKHRGHEAMHAEMVLILIVTLVVAQILLVQWKQRHFRSYQAELDDFALIILISLLQVATLIGMWIIPIFLCLKFEWIRFVVIWFFFSIVSGYVTYRATRKPIAGNTPRLAVRGT